METNKNTTIRFAALSDRGRVRPRNEDRYCTIGDQQIFVVSDGIGSHMAGDLAAQLVVDHIPERLQVVVGDPDRPFDPLTIDRARAVVAQLSHEIRDQGSGTPGMHGLGATVVAVAIRCDQALVMHLGDSRAYLLRGTSWHEVTIDHTVTQILQKDSKTQREIINSEGLNQLTRYMGMAGNVLVEAQIISIIPGDQWLLCTDGLSSVVPPARIQEILEQRLDPAESCRRLVHCANSAGSPDNVTVVVVAIDETEL